MAFAESRPVVSRSFVLSCIWYFAKTWKKGSRNEVQITWCPVPTLWRCQALGWRNDGRELFYMAGAAGGTGKLMAVSLTIAGDRVTAAAPPSLFDCMTTAGYSAVTDNGRRFLVLERVKATPKPLTLLLNRQTKLRT